MKKISYYIRSITKVIQHFTLGYTLFLLLASCTWINDEMEKDIPLYSDNYTIQFETHNKLTSITEDYFFNELKNRASDKSIIKNNNEDNDQKLIKIVLIAGHIFDYEIKTEKNKIELIANSEKNLQWLFYQFIKKLSIQDDRIRTQDLPPAIIAIKETAIKFPFEYREPHFYPALQKESSIIYNINNVENDWGIWGHNLGKLLHKEEDSNTFATINGNKTNQQWCFSADATYNYIENYIINNFGTTTKEKYSFMLVPNDNTLVCQDEKCKSLGNTITSATPSVMYLIEKLANKFPQYNFFTTAYLTVDDSVIRQLPKNVGIMISTIRFPKSVQFAKKNNAKIFESKIKKWKANNNKIYLWDYVSNFDDYLSPYPFFTRLKQQLQYFKELGVKGIFLNGSGYDYTSFQELKTYVSSALLLNPDLDVNTLIKNYFTQEYPQNHTWLAEYCIKIEKNAQSYNLPCDIYSNRSKSINANIFFNFYTKLKQALTTTTGKEKSKLQELLVGLSFTYLQLAVENKNSKHGYFDIQNNQNIIVRKEIINAYETLQQHSNYTNFKRFKEEEGTISSFLKEFEQKIINNKKPLNKLFGKKIKPLSKLDEDYQNIDMLTDNSIGFQCDYHRGWLIASQQNLTLQLPKVQVENSTLQINFLNDPNLKIILPTKVEIYKNEELYKIITVDYNTYKSQKNIVEFKTTISIEKKDTIIIKVIPENKNQKIACDEIQLF